MIGTATPWAMMRSTGSRCSSRASSGIRSVTCVRITEFDREIATLDILEIRKSSAEGVDGLREAGRLLGGDPTDAINLRRCLRMRAQRQCGQCDGGIEEPASFHWHLPRPEYPARDRYCVSIAPHCARVYFDPAPISVRYRDMCRIASFGFASFS